MPIYQYKCRNCGANIEKMQSVTADPLVECPECHQPRLKRVLQPVGIIFKGSGWYITDSKKSGSAVTASGGASGDGRSAESQSTEKAASSSSESKSSEPVTSTSS